MRRNANNQTIDRSSFGRWARHAIYFGVSALLLARVESSHAQEIAEPTSESESNGPDSHAGLKRRVERLETELAELKRLLKEYASVNAVNAKAGNVNAVIDVDALSTSHDHSPS